MDSPDLVEEPKHGGRHIRMPQIANLNDRAFAWYDDPSEFLSSGRVSHVPSLSAHSEYGKRMLVCRTCKHLPQQRQLGFKPRERL
jgi:hypothetical protein